MKKKGVEHDSMTFVDYYRILGITRNADERAIRSAYRRLAQRHHPDVAKGQQSVERFLLIREAYEILSNPEKRRRYDRLRPDALLSQSTVSAVEPVASHRGFRLVIDALGLQIELGFRFFR